MWMPGIFSSCRILPITSRTAMLVPMANSPTRSLFSSVWQYRQNSSSSSLFAECASRKRLPRISNGQRRLAQIAVLFAKIIAHHAINHERAIHAFGRGEGFAAGQIAPLVRADDAAGLEPFELRRKAPDDVGARGIGGANLRGGAGHLPNLRADAIDFFEIGAHAFEHDAPVDIDHMGMAHLAAVHHIGHLHARAQFVGLRLHREDAHIAGFHDRPSTSSRHVFQRPRRQVFQNPGVIAQLARLEFARQRRADLRARAIGDQRDLLFRLNAQAVLHCVARARS